MRTLLVPDLLLTRVLSLEVLSSGALFHLSKDPGEGWRGMILHHQVKGGSKE